MKNLIMTIFVGASLALATPTLLWAHEETGRMQRSINQINRQARSEEGQQYVVRKINNQFNISKETIESLHAKGLSYGEIAMALSITESMEGGITMENINAVVQSRLNGHKSWGEIAEGLHINPELLGKRLGVSEGRLIDVPRDQAKEPKGPENTGVDQTTFKIAPEPEPRVNNRRSPIGQSSALLRPTTYRVENRRVGEPRLADRDHITPSRISPEGSPDHGTPVSVGRISN